MTDTALFRRAAGALPTLVLPVMGTCLVRQLFLDDIPRALFGLALPALEEMGYFRVIALLGIFLLTLLVVSAAAALLLLGAFRLCLDRGEGRPGRMPWTILREWRRYKGWLFWVGLVPIFWKTAQRTLEQVLVSSLEYRAVERFFTWKGYLNVALFLLSLLLLSLLSLAVRTVFVRNPEGGFWRSVVLGVREGLHSWPRTIGAQLKFVIPVSLGVSLVNALLSNLAFRVGGAGISQICNFAGRLLGLTAQTWVLVFYGFLASDRIPPAEEPPFHMD